MLFGTGLQPHPWFSRFLITLRFVGIYVRKTRATSTLRRSSFVPSFDCSFQFERFRKSEWVRTIDVLSVAHQLASKREYKKKNEEIKSEMWAARWRLTRRLVRQAEHPERLTLSNVTRRVIGRSCQRTRGIEKRGKSSHVHLITWSKKKEGRRGKVSEFLLTSKTLDSWKVL